MRRVILTMNQQSAVDKLEKAMRKCQSAGLVIGVNNRNGAFIIDTAENMKKKAKKKTSSKGKMIAILVSVTAIGIYTLYMRLANAELTETQLFLKMIGLG